MLRSVLIVAVIVSASAFESKSVGYGWQAGNTSLALCNYEDTCSVGNIDGVCVSISAGCCSGAVTSGLCPGSSDIKCCTSNSCSTPSGTGTCKQTSACGGTAYAGYCSGPSDLQCCVENQPAPPPPTCDYQGTCSNNYIEGVCVSVSAGCCSGTTTSGLCPGSDDIKCCTSNTCATPAGAGTCLQTSLCTGTSYSGYCSGPSDLQCCVGGTPPVPPSPTDSQYGVDVSSTMTADTANCLASSGKSFVIPRGYCSDGSLDSKVCNTLNSAYSAGIKTRDTYIFPCPTCSSSANTQLTTLVNYLNGNCQVQWSGRVWLDIEGSQYWTGNTDANRAWYQSLVDACTNNGVRCGVYSSASQWSAIFGSLSYSYGANLPLWYAHYDGNPSFSDFSAFAGWATPYAKQYEGDVSLCGMGVDLNYSPGF